MKVMDLTNQRFGRLVVLVQDDSDKNGHAKWICECDCGNVVSVYGSNLVRNLSISCGCFRVQHTKLSKTTHGCTDTPIYKKWEGMKRRCSTLSGSRYGYYKKKGIQVCAEWIEFENFKQWAIANGYQDNLSLDRIDNSQGYCPDNCRWVTFSQQMHNKTNNRVIEYNGIKHDIAEWAAIVGLKYDTLRSRLLILKWPVVDALFTVVEE